MSTMVSKFDHLLRKGSTHSLLGQLCPLQLFDCVHSIYGASEDGVSSVVRLFMAGQSD